MSLIKPPLWPIEPFLTEAPSLHRNTVIFPYWEGASALYNNQWIRPSTITDFAPRATELGMGYGQDGDDGADVVKYPSALFDQSGISELTFVMWCKPFKSSATGDGGNGDLLLGNTAANDDGVRAFLMRIGDSRWRLPEAAGNVDITPSWSAGDIIQYVGMLGRGQQRLEVWNHSTKTLATNESASTASITFNEGIISTGNGANNTVDLSSFPGDLIVGYLSIGHRWTEFEIQANRRNPFNLITMADDVPTWLSAASVAGTARALALRHQVLNA